MTPPPDDEPPVSGERGPSRLEGPVELALDLSRGLVLIPVAVLVLAALGAFVYGTVVFVDAVRRVVDHPLPVGNKIGLFLLVVDLFLVGATLLIAAIGLYELFISRLDAGGVERVPLPPWLEMRDLNDLKARVLAMIVLVTAVSFVEVVVDAGPGQQVLELGAGIALVIVAITAFLRYGNQVHGDE